MTHTSTLGELEEASGYPETLQNIQFVLRLADEYNASDVILTVHAPPLLSVHGNLIELNDFLPLKAEDMAKYVSSIMVGDQKTINEQLNANHDFEFSYDSSGATVYRCNVSRTGPGHLMLVMRRVPRHPGSFKDLNLPEQALINVITRPKGLVLVTGPTGSGKSTTLAACLDYLNHHSPQRRHILTVEDPIEFPYDNDRCLFTQRQVGSSTRSYAEAMRSALRMIPDVLMIGEIRDAETMGACMEMADTGKLVLATLHTNSGVETVSRVVNFFDNHSRAAHRLAQTLIATLSVRLVARSDRPGRYPIVEIMNKNIHVQQAIENQNLDKLRSLMREDSSSLDNTLYKAVIDRIITRDTALAHADQPEELKKRLPQR